MMPNSEIMTVTSETASTSEAAGWLVQQNFRWVLEQGRRIRGGGIDPQVLPKLYEKPVTLKDITDRNNFEDSY